jgi:hypothetical protein
MEVNEMFKGEEIRSNGFCSSIILRGRVDTLVCLPHFITEMEQQPEAAPEQPTAGREARS